MIDRDQDFGAATRRAVLQGGILAGMLGSSTIARAAAAVEASPPSVAANISKVDRAKRNLVIVNRVLANEGVLDAYGHVSIRHPEDPKRFFLSRSLAPELVELSDIGEYRIDGSPISEKRPIYLERFIHAGILSARPEVNIVIHGHAEALIPFGLSKVPLRAAAVTGEFGKTVPVWDIADKFGDTNMLVENLQEGQDLARTLADNQLVLMRGHGFALADQSIVRGLYLAVFLPKNARILMDAMRLGDPKYLSDGELAARSKIDPNSPSYLRSWEYWATKAGCKDLL